MRVSVRATTTAAGHPYVVPMHRSFALGPPYRRRTPDPVVDCGSIRSCDRSPEGSARPVQMNDFLIQLIVVAVLANVVLLLAALIAPRLRRQSRPLATASPGGGGEPLGVAPVTISAAMPPSAPEPPLSASEALGGSSTDMRSDTEESQRRFRMPPEDEYPSTRSIEAFLTAGQRREDAGPDRMVDDETGLDTGFAWEVAVEREEKRVSRYGKSVTVVVAELDRLEALAARLGPDNADRLVPPVATTLRRMARAADLVARTGNARFQVLMPETDEVQAINYVERVRDACDMWLEAAAVSVRLVVGWASAGSGVTIRDATRLAEQRMHADRARPTYRRGRAPGAPWAAAPGPASPARDPGGSGEDVVSPVDGGPSDSDRPGTSEDAAVSPSPAEERWQPGPATGPTI